MTEHEQARLWRESHGLSRDSLAELTGYSQLSIYWFERGCTPPRAVERSGRGKPVQIKPAHKPIPDWVWQRYKRACEGVQRQLEGRKFKWT